MTFPCLNSMHRPWARRLVAVLATLAGLTACGGRDADREAAGVSADAEVSMVASAPIGARSVIAPLLHDDGTAAAVDPAAQPTDAGARTRSGLYASVAQARQLADTLGAHVLQIEVGCCGAEAVEQAVGIVWGLQAAHDLPARTPVLVRGTDLRLAAAAANRLAEGGLTHVWLVTP